MLENILLLAYIITFAWIISLKKKTIDGSGLRKDNINLSSFDFYDYLNHYFLRREFETLSDID